MTEKKNSSISKYFIQPSHLIDFIAMFYCIETVALAYTGKMLENIYGEECYSQQIYKK